MKQIIIATNYREKLTDPMLETDFHVTWCPLTIEGILSVRDRSNVLFLCPRDEDDDDLKKIGLYMRDLCIEDEKILYIYGNRVGVDILRARVPALFLRMYAYTASQPFSTLLNNLNDLEKETPVDRPGLMILDISTDFVEKLRMQLEPYFRIYVSHFDLAELGIMVLRSNIVLMGTDQEMKLLDYMEILGVLYKRKRMLDFHLYYLTATEADRERLMKDSGGSSISFSRDMDVSQVADYFIRSFAQKAPAQETDLFGINSKSLF